jgi:hypothetical protein
MIKKELVVCPACKSAKKVMGMGMMTSDCSHCGGIGWVEKPEEIQVAEAPPIKDLGEVLKKRKKRNKVIKTEDVSPSDFHKPIQINKVFESERDCVQPENASEYVACLTPGTAVNITGAVSHIVDGEVKDVQLSMKNDMAVKCE